VRLRLLSADAEYLTCGTGVLAAASVPWPDGSPVRPRARRPCHTGSMLLRSHLVSACCLTIALALSSQASAVELTREQQVEILNEAGRAFDRGANVRQSNSAEAIEAFTESAAKFQLLADAGIRNGKLYYNLGNAYLESEHLGKAILNYRRAQELLPGDGRIENNLRYARSLRRDQIETAGKRAFLHTLFFWHYGTSLRIRFLTGLFVYVAFWLMLIYRTLFHRFRWRYVLIPALVIWVTLGISVAADMLGASRNLEGVIVADDVVVRKGNGERFEPQFKQQLHEGVEFTVIEQHGDWLYIELPDGKTGWIQTRQAELI